VSKVAHYRQVLRALDDWDAFLRRESGLPGPRANLELVQAVAEEGDAARFQRYLAFGPEQAPVNSPQAFLAVCGVVGLGRLLAEGHHEFLATLRRCAADPRWRIREGVAMALQRLGDVDMAVLLQVAEEWSQGDLLEQRAAAAAVCEPRLLGQPEHVGRVLQLLDGITASLTQVVDRRSDDFRVLRQALGYCWSVAVAAWPEKGRAMMEHWLASSDRDVRWVMRENLRKNRLQRLDAAWVERCKAQLGL
jgi:hypothetical protein